MKRLIIILIVFFVLKANDTFSSEVNKKFGKVSIEELLNDVCPIDSNAHAYYIFDEGSTSFSYIEGFKITFVRHFRIKILDNIGLKNAEFVIPLYTGSNGENIGSIKAVTYNLEKGNKVVSQKISNDAIFREEASKYITNVKFALPNVKPGSVIEVNYRISSPRAFSIPDWNFQYYIPVLLTEYSVAIPEYYIFNQTLRGYYLIDHKKGYSNGSINFKDGSSLAYSENKYDFSYENMPAFPVGEYLSTPDNYISKISFEISQFEIPGKVYKNYNSTWDDVTKLFIDNSDFGERLKAVRFLNDETDRINNLGLNDQDKMNEVFNFIKNRTSWNERKSCWCSQSLKNTYDEGEGNSADINLLMVSLLKEVGLSAYPVALSTRSNGIIHPSHPSISQLNYLICLCVIEGENYLLDATEKYASVNVLPTRCLNGKGRIISNEWSDWIPLLSGKKRISISNYNLTLNKSEEFIGSLIITDKEFSAFRKRVLINDFETPQKYVDDLVEDHPGLTIKDFDIQNLDSINEDITLTYNVEIKDKAELMGDLLIFSPLFFDAYEKNPLSLEKREYPVEYPQPIDDLTQVTIVLPDSYAVESIPEDVNVNVLDGKGVFVFSAIVVDSTIQLSSRLNINKTIFPATEYEQLKEFYEIMVKKQQEKVVLKKKVI